MSKTFVVILVVLGVLVLVVAGAFTAFEFPAACGLCHDENTILKSWEKTPMGKGDVDCMDCHADSGFFGHIEAHIHGVAYLFAGERTSRADVPADRCLVCHFKRKTVSQRQVAAKHFESYMKDDTKCEECHFQVAHIVLDKKRVPKTVEDGWAGVDVCKRCHEEAFKVWEEESRHAEAMNTLQPKMIANANCIGCHTLGFKKDGFVSLEKTPQLANVQCENCHGKGEKHIAQPKAVNAPRASLKADMCGECHSGSHHDTFSDTEWKATKHAKALVTLQELDKKAPGAVKDSCLLCHSADYILAPADKKPTLKSAKETLTCQACHSGHSTQTRLPKDLLCQSCHQGEGLKAGDAVHHPTREMFFGKTIPGSGVFSPGSSKHVANNIGCPNCHMSKRAYASEAMPAKTGHDFLAKPEGCVVCHSGKTVEEMTALIAEIQAPTKAALAELKPRIDAAKAKYKELSKDGKAKVKDEIKTPYDLAILGYDFVDQDSSNGFHNPGYSAKMLDLCRVNLPLFEAAAK